METIAAIATAQGEAGVGIVRISGDDALDVVQKVFCLPSGGKCNFIPRYMHYGYACQEDGSRIDEVLAVVMPAPYSFTGENVAELHCHGGKVVLNKILEAVILSGARLAFAGEFVKQAFMNGKMDLTQAEAIADIIAAKSSRLLSISGRQYKGEFRSQVEAILDKLLDMIAAIEVAVDYPEEEDYAFFESGQVQILSDIVREVSDLCYKFEGSRVLRNGLRIALVGVPNVGKSTLLNALLDEDRAIVTDIAGTTRDVIEGNALIEGVPVTFVDTAGLREAENEVERLGIERSKREMTSADLVLYVVDAESQQDMSSLEEVLKRLSLDSEVILVFNKMDKVSSQSSAVQLSEYPQAFISAKDGKNIDVLRKMILETVFAAGLSDEDLPALINERQGAALKQAFSCLETAFCGLKSGVGLDFVVVDLETARLTLGEVTGMVAGEDVLNRVFEKFCLGK